MLPLMLAFHFSAVAPEDLTKRLWQCQSLPSSWKSWCWIGFLVMLPTVPWAQPLLAPCRDSEEVDAWWCGKSGPLCRWDCPDPTVGVRMGPAWVWAFVHPLGAFLHSAGAAESCTEPWRSCWPYGGTYRMLSLKGTCKITAFAHFRNTLDYFPRAGISYVFFQCWKARREAGKGESLLAAVLF